LASNRQTPRLDKAGSLANVAPVPRLTKITALLLAALWLPAILHCDFEAAEIAFLTHEEHDHHHDAPADDHHGGADASHSIEHVAYTTSAPALKAPPPPDSFSAVLVALAFSCTYCAEPVLSPTSHPPPPDLLAAWQFLYRAAPQARAPGHLIT